MVLATKQASPQHAAHHKCFLDQDEKQLIVQACHAYALCI